MFQLETIITFYLYTTSNIWDPNPSHLIPPAAGSRLGDLILVISGAPSGWTPTGLVVITYPVGR